MPNETQRFVTVKEAADYLGVDPETIRRRIKSNDIRAHKNPITRRVSIEWDSLVEFARLRNMEGNG